MTTNLDLNYFFYFISYSTKASLVQNAGTLQDIVADLTSKGDHHNNIIVQGINRQA